jgi:UDP-glucose 4-epimerase
MKIVVTGGRGFIGGAVCAWGAGLGHQMIPYDRSDGFDVRTPAFVPRSDAIIHLAGILGTSELFDQPYEAVDVNVNGPISMLQVCEGTGARFVGITMPPVFPSVYTATKICADRFATAWHHTYDLPVSHVRAFNAYGPGQKYGPGHPQKFMPTFSTLAWNNQPLPIWGDGEQTVDMIFVNDLGRMLVEAVEHGDDVTFDGGTGVAVTVNEVANFVIKTTGSTAGIQYLPMRRGETPTHIVAQGEGWDRLSWKPQLDWENVWRTVQAYKP